MEYLDSNHDDTLVVSKDDQRLGEKGHDWHR